MKTIHYPQDVLDQMNEIVENCMGDAPAYCQATCPMHTDVKGYINLIAEKKYTDSIQLIREKLFLPASLGRICAHPCEDSCKRNDAYKEPMSIAMLKRFVADNFDDESKWSLDMEPSTGKKIAVIGAGPAGAQAALDLRKKGHDIDIFEKLDVLGGMMRVGIPEYRLPRDVIDYEYKLLEKLGVNFHMGFEIGKDRSFEDIKNSYDAVVMAIGAHKGGVVPIEGHEADGVLNAVDFLREVSLTRKADIGKKVVVIGGGNVAVDVARSARRVGAEEVYMVCLEESCNMPAHGWEVDEAIEEGIILHDAYGPDKILSSEGKVTGLEVKKCISIFDENNSFAPKFDCEKKIVLDVEQVIFAVGQAVDSDFAKDDTMEFNRGGRFKVDDVTLQTNVENVFVAGDASGRSLIVIEAMAEGRKAAISIDRYLKGEDMKVDRDYEGTYDTWLETELKETDEDIARVKTQQNDPEERIKSFDEVDHGYDEIKAVEEASRCLVCECKHCMQECIMLNDYCECPKDLFEKIVESGDVDPEIPYSCNMCNQCTIVCPKDFKISASFFDIRKKMVEANNGKSPMKGHNAIEVHQTLGFSKLFNTSKGSK